MAKLTDYDFIPGNKESFEMYKETFQREYNSREFAILRENYETILQMQANFFKQQSKGREARVNFYNTLKHLAQK